MTGGALAGRARNFQERMMMVSGFEDEIANRTLPGAYGQPVLAVGDDEEVDEDAEDEDLDDEDLDDLDEEGSEDEDADDEDEDDLDDEDELEEEEEA